MGDVPAGRESVNPLQIAMISDVNLTPVYRENTVITPPPQNPCGACGSGAGVGMIMAFIGWFGLRFVGPRRNRRRGTNG